MDLLFVCRAEPEVPERGLLEGGQDWPLSRAGRHQSEFLGQRLAQDYAPAALYSSPLRAAWETARGIGLELGLSPQVVPDLRDLNCAPLPDQTGQPAGRTRPDRDIFAPFPGGESYVDMHVRVVKAVNRLVKDAGGGTIAVVTHPRPIQAFLLAFLRYAIEQRVELVLRCDPASLHHLRRSSDGGKEIVRLNDTAHLRVSRGEIV